MHEMCKIGAYSFDVEFRKHFFKSTDTFGDDVTMPVAVTFKKIDIVERILRL